MIMGRDNHMEVLILGMGWTSTFLVPLLHEEGVRCAKTTTTGRDGTIKFKFDPESDDTEQFKQLPDAQTILITFPVKGAGASKHLLKLYGETHPSADPRWIQLGSTGIFQIPGQNLWVTRHSKYDRENARAIAEDELLEMGGCVLNLSGLWGGSRDPREWVKRVATTKDQLRDKASLHMVHGQDVARAIYALHKNYTPKERWVSLGHHGWHALIFIDAN